MRSYRFRAMPGPVLALAGAITLLAAGCAAPGGISARMAGQAATAPAAAVSASSHVPAHPAAAVTLRATVRRGAVTRVAWGPSLAPCGTATAVPHRSVSRGQERCLRPVPPPARFRCPRPFSHQLFPCRMG